MIGIYRITHLATGRHYVGQSLNIPKRWQAHKDRKTSHISKAICKYGTAAFEFTVICQCLPSELNALEKFWVDELKALTEGFNKRTGGDQPRLSQESRDKISRASKARWASNHEALASILREAVTRDDVRLKVSNSLKKYHSDLTEPERSARDSSRIAGIREATSIAKIGKSTRERWLDPAMRERMLRPI